MQRHEFTVQRQTCPFASISHRALRALRALRTGHNSLEFGNGRLPAHRANKRNAPSRSCRNSPISQHAIHSMKAEYRHTRQSEQALRARRPCLSTRMATRGNLDNHSRCAAREHMAICNLRVVGAGSCPESHRYLANRPAPLANHRVHSSRRLNFATVATHLHTSIRNDGHHPPLEGSTLRQRAQFSRSRGRWQSTTLPRPMALVLVESITPSNGQMDKPNRQWHRIPRHRNGQTARATNHRQQACTCLTCGHLGWCCTVA